MITPGLASVGAGAGVVEAVAAEVISWPVAITGAAAMTLVVALWLGIWQPVLRRLEA